MNTSSLSIYAIIPAAGRSRRMGNAKQLLDIDGRPMLNVVLDSLVAADVFGVMLVTHRMITDALKTSIGDKINIVYNEDESSEMIDSIRMGLHAWRDRCPVDENDGFLICPADQPGISTADFNTCISAFRATPDRIVIASRDRQKGHPIIFPASLAAFVESSACDEGLNALPRGIPERVRLIPCASLGVVRDIDTPEDYASF